MRAWRWFVTMAIGFAAGCWPVVATAQRSEVEALHQRILHLDAEWVVLSACNTAAGAVSKAHVEALSGLARSFLYAGTRALLVSHWYVDSDATVHLITATFAAMQANPAIGRAEALRRSMLTLIATGGHHAHPAHWGPFIVVGEGGSSTPAEVQTVTPRRAAKVHPGNARAVDWRREIWRR